MKKTITGLLISIGLLWVSQAHAGPADLRISPSGNFPATSRLQTASIDSFSAEPAQCAAGLQNASVKLSWVLKLGVARDIGNKVSVDVLVNGVSQGIQSLRVQTIPSIQGVGTPIISGQSDLQLRGNSGSASIAFVVAGGARTANQVISYSCLTLAPTSPELPRNLTAQRPDLAIGPHIFVDYFPPIRPAPPRGFNLFEERVSLGRSNRPSRGSVSDDLSRPMLDLWNTPLFNCPAEGEAFVTVKFFISVIAKGVTPAYFVKNEGFYRFEKHDSPGTTFIPGAEFFDTRNGPLGGDGLRELPAGYEWVAFHRVLPCTFDGIIEFNLDPENTLQETDETNNRYRRHFATKRPR